MLGRKILLFGGSGMLGTRIKELMNSNYDLSAPTRKIVDLASKEAIQSFIENFKPDVIVYAAGVTSQVLAEKRKKLARQLNVISPGWVAKTAGKSSIPVIYFSTDAVFPCNNSNQAYKEHDRVKPINYYGFTKALGEENVLSEGRINVVIRISSLYSCNFEKKIDFVRKQINSFSKEKEVFGIEDQMFTPTFVDCAVKSLKKIIDLKLSGIFHISSKDFISNYKFTELIAEEFGYSKKLIRKIKFEDYFNDGIKRGQYCWLDSSKALKVLGDSVICRNRINLRNLALQFKKNA